MAVNMNRVFYTIQRKKQYNKGFTLVELIIVVAILAILVGLLVPQYINHVEKSRKSTDASNLEQLVSAVKIAVADSDYNLDPGGYTVAIRKNDAYLGIDTGSTEENVKKLIQAMKEYTEYDFQGSQASGYTCTDLKLKTDRWTDLGEWSMIYAYIQVKKDSSFLITYFPDDIQDFADAK